MQAELAHYFKKIFQEHFNITNLDIAFSEPPNKKMGDLAFGCFPLAKALKKSPQAIAEDLKNIVESDESFGNFIEKLEIAGPYLNIFLAKNAYTQKFIDFLFGQELRFEKKDETVVIDYIGANVGKPLHIAHMCTPSQGQTIINVYNKLGYNVVSDSHICDWGSIFGKLITAYKRFGSEEKLEENAVEHLFELYVKINKEAEEDSQLEEEFRETFKKLSQGDEELTKLWKSFTESSVEAMNIQLARLGVYTQYNIGEGFYEGIGLPKMEDYPDLKFNMKDIVKELVEKNIASRNEDGSVGVVFPEESNIPSCILQKRNGTHGYLASDLASVKYRIGSWNPEKIIYFVDVRQQLHLQQTFYIAKLAGWLERGEREERTQLFHAYNGFISLKDGAMSTRKGKIIPLEKLLNEAEERAKKIILEKRDDIDGKELNKLAKIIGIGAVKYGYLKKTRESDVVFDWDEFMTFEGNSGPYIQYAYVRAKNILEKAEFTSTNDISEIENIDYSSDFQALVLKLMEYENILRKTVESAHPHILANYCYDLAKLSNTLYNTESILGEEDANYKILKLKALEKYTHILREAFMLLAIEMPEKM